MAFEISYIAPKFFVSHPVSKGLLTYREFEIALRYIEKKKEVEQSNKILLRNFPNAIPQALPPFPRFTGDPNENKAHIVKYVEDFLKLSKAATYVDGSDDEDNIEIYESEQESNESGYVSNSPERVNSSPQPNQLLKTSLTEMTLLYSFGDICFYLINGNECEDSLCDARHAFLTRKEIRDILRSHTDAQLNQAFELVLRSKVLKKRYYEVFESLFNAAASDNSNA